MPQYQAYAVQKGRRADLPALFEAASDDDAIPQARALLDGPYIQLWQDERFVMGLRKPVKNAPLPLEAHRA
ncbi:MAG: hypothetical protein K2Z80_12140 [Xanthobacteraceae bacterium]|nr:hypothetical protein [Xanthobacteraceae bacterium]MBX9842550.1 hypothetical protein [Xanthobacteraceae bacterium]